MKHNAQPLSIDQVAARKELAEVMRKRKDRPLIGEYTDGEGCFCFFGLAFETYRKKHPDKFFWFKNVRPCATSHHPIRCGLVESFARAWKPVCEWLGLTEHGLDHLIHCNDEYEYAWDDLADTLMTVPDEAWQAYLQSEHAQ